ncbi:dual specificity protein phosphatase family protein [Desulfogranum marinum]|uniref:protein-tyrosine phosphatase family protein n=1 Tax=Desulfogranum marinum TaxID=453220 RepID=UPI001965927B|nr:dual specificity protein phosphatase family protein [Desulfogranum marinum]MBM9511126.1 dual specificity protein phosphatase family protein [Desulfogranum marinum]
MSTYKLTWITDHLAVGHAPMSYDDFDSIKEQGITGIVNLCGEFSDLHELEEAAGFEVFYLPIPDETAPKMELMEKGLEWLDEAVYLGKKVLVHCKLGVGRTGTFVTAYMLRRGFNLKKAGKLLKKTRANPTNYSQWWLLRKFGKKEGQLKMGEPSANNRSGADLSFFYARYEQLLERVDAQLSNKSSECCSQDSSPCPQSFKLSLIEALYLNHKVNIALSSARRNQVIQKAAANITAKENADGNIVRIPDNPNALEAGTKNSCPLREGDKCLLHQYRPIHCRTNSEKTELQMEEINKELALLSKAVFSALFETDPQSGVILPEVSNQETISGKFIQRYFQYLVSQKNRQ